MKFIDRDNSLLATIKRDNFIISSSIVRINIQKESELVIEIDIKLLYNGGQLMRLKFSKLDEFSFYHSSNYSFYYVESYKLLKQGELFFISFDPDESTLAISENDQDYILCGSFEAYYIG